MLNINERYTFSISACNFLGKCGISSKSVTKLSISRPIVTISGPQEFSITRKTSLKLESDAYFPLCGGGKSYNGLTFQWFISVNGIISLNPLLQPDRTVNRDTSTFFLPAYRFEVGNKYDIKVTVKRDGVRYGGEAGVIVLVESANIIPVITGGQKFSVGPLEPLNNINIDASRSYDEDKPGVFGTDAALLFKWSCSQVSPTPIFNSCPSLILSRTTTPSLGVIFAQDGIMSELTLEVYDNPSYISNQNLVRSVIKTVLVETLQANSPVVSSDIGEILQFNIKNEIYVRGTVRIELDAIAEWTVSPPIPNFKSLLKTKQTSLVLRADSTVAFRRFDLPVLPNVLGVDKKYTFTLTCFYPSNNKQSSTSVFVETNGPPTPGVVEVSPTSGEEIMTSFKLSAKFWEDVDRPLTYDYGCIDGNSVITYADRVRARSLSNIMLSQGSEFHGYNRTIFVSIFDGLGSNQTVFLDVTVYPYGYTRRLPNNGQRMLGEASEQQEISELLQQYNQDSLGSIDSASPGDLKVANIVQCVRRSCK